ncbi:unnamed protein product [Medioppia subpectinata]|uniref:EF-hand domain-containing protein n=1 Tax=Medioppia subpectinata TaxID=1979941 RepID=A0A7R9Q1R6_9ACAR|nr:unnamed protein product [Medioppia subpectinata]CAG2109534.1 unnamed protein product [Medioppia subpectinata]
MFGLMAGLTLVFDWGNIWDHFIPDSITEPIEEKRKQLGRVIKKICGVKRVDALTIQPTISAAIAEAETSPSSGNSDTKGEHKSHKKNRFRDRKIIEYENRIRLYSNPDKVFRYFASLKIIYEQNESEIYMTPDDFLRALTPGIKQPDGLGLDRFRRIDLSKVSFQDSDLSAMLSDVLLIGNKDLAYGLKPESIFYKLSNYGLINYSDFLFLLTVISVSKRHFEIAFRMFDLNGDGNVEYDEFEKVQNAILAQTCVSSALAKYFFGEDLKQKLTIEKFLDFQQLLQTELLTLEFERKKPNPITGRIKESEFAELLIAYAGLTEKRKNKMLQRVKKRFGKDEDGLSEEGITLDDYLSVSSALAKYFFGEDLKQKLTIEKFLDFQQLLQTELLTLEFERKKPNPITGRIKESEFAELLIAYAGLTEKRKSKMLQRVKKRFGKDEDGLSEEGITLDDYLSLYSFLQNINDVDIALAVFNIAGASIDQATLKHVAKTVVHVHLRDHLVEVLFTLFDENQDGQLSNREFIAVMKERLRRGLTKPKDTGFFKLLHAIWNSLKFDL